MKKLRPHSLIAACVLMSVLLIGCKEQEIKPSLNQQPELAPTTRAIPQPPIALPVATPAPSYYDDMARVFVRAENGDRNASSLFVTNALNSLGLLNPRIAFHASAYAGEANRIQDAAFFYYAGRMRLQLDRFMFRPAPKAAVDELNLLSQRLGALINPRIMREPKQYKALTKRLSTWYLLPDDAYRPDWPFNQVPAIQTVSETAKRIQENSLKEMQVVSTLLSDHMYFEAFVILQDYPKLDEASKRLPQNVALRQRAIERVTRIEKSKGISLLSHLYR